MMDFFREIFHILLRVISHLKEKTRRYYQLLCEQCSRYTCDVTYKYTYQYYEF